MIFKKLLHDLPAPIIVGGVGGSGTRLVVDILQSQRVFMGHDLNKSNDNMSLARKFSKIRSIIQSKGLTWFKNGQIKNNKKLRLIFKGFLREYFNQDFFERNTAWGWKVPANFILLDLYKDIFKEIKYVHVIRNGLDMAFSNNQNQLKNWGGFFGIDIDHKNLSLASLNYWLMINELVLEKYKDIYILSFDNLISDTTFEISELLNYVGLQEIDIDKALKLVKTPKSIGRYKNKDLNLFDKSLLLRLEKFGYKTE